MSLPHILLGMLSEPASGYDLKKTFEQSIRHFWSAELSQIYPALARLEKKGHLKATAAPSEKGPPRKIYSRTESGLDELVRWLEGGAELKQERVHFLSQVFFLEAIPSSARFRYMQGLRDAFAARLDALSNIEDGWRGQDPSYPNHLPDRDFYPQLTLRLGLMKFRTLVDWADECLSVMEARSERPPPSAM